MRNLSYRIATALVVAIVIACATSALLAQSVTTWRVGDVFVGVGSFADSNGTYKTLDGTGHVKLDVFGAAVPDLQTSTSWTTSCFVDPTVSNGDLWVTSWADMTLGHFSGVDHSRLDSFSFNDPNALPIPLPGGGTDYIALPSVLAALPRDPGVPPLPADALGDVAKLNSPHPSLGESYAQAIDNGDLSVVNAPMPAIQALNAVIVVKSGPYAGQMYVGTGVPSDNGIGRGNGYLLRLKYTAGTLTLTGWWNLDAGAIADRTLDRLQDPADALNLVDGSSNGAGGIDNIDLSSDQQTVFYTSQDPYIRRVNVTTGQPGTPIALQQQVGTDWNLIADARALGIRALPGKVDPTTGAFDPTGAGDGSAGFLVAVPGGLVYRVDKDGRVLYHYAVAGRPAALTLAPDAQYFWTATTEDDPFNPQPGGGLLYRFHISSGVGTGPFSPYGPPFAPGATADGHGAYGLCVKREYFAGVTSVDQEKACFAMNADGSPQLDASGNPIADYCRTPTLCSPFARGVALSPSGVPLGPADPANDDCYPPGAHKPTFPNQHSHETDTISLDLAQGNPDYVIDGVEALPFGLQAINGIVSGTISTADCGIQNGTCSHAVIVHGHFTEDIDSGGNVAFHTDGTFTWLVDDGNSTPTLALAPGASTIATVLYPYTIPLLAFDQDANDSEILRLTGGPPGMTITPRTGYGNGYAASISGTPAADPPYDHHYSPVIDLFDCNGDWADHNAATATVADLQNAIAAGNCYHHVSKTVALTITNLLPTFSAAIANQFNNANSPIAGFTVTATDADQHLPIRFTITGLPAGLDYCHVDPATGSCPAAPSAWHTPIVSNKNPAAQTIQIVGVPTTPVNNASVLVKIDDLALGETATSFQWTIYGAPTLSLGPKFTDRGTPDSVNVAAVSPNADALTYVMTTPASNLPPGIAFTNTSDSHVLSGTPSQAGYFGPITIQVTDNTGAANGLPPLVTAQSFFWTIDAPPSLTVTSRATRLGVPVPAGFSVCAAPPCAQPAALYPAPHVLSYAFATGSLPAGLFMDPATGIVTGSPTSLQAPQPFTIKVTDTTSQNHLSTTSPAGTTWLVWDDPALAVADQSTLVGSVVNVQLPGVAKPSGLTLTYAITAGALPAGLTLDPSTGRITGTANTPINPASVTVTVTQTTPGVTPSPTATAAFKWLVYQTGTVTAHDQISAQNRPIAPVTISASGFPSTQQPLTWDVQGLPSGLTFTVVNSTTGIQITGTPTVAVVSQPVTVKVTDTLHQTATVVFNWTVDDPPVVTPANQVSFAGVGIAPYQVQAAGGNTPLTFAFSGLPAGLSSSGSGVVTGTPTAANIAGNTVSVTVTDSLGIATSGTFRWIVDTIPTVTPSAQTSVLNSPVSYQIPATDPDGQALTYAVANLPAGLTANGSGLVTGTPTTLVNGQTVTVKVTDPLGGTDTKTFPWTVIANHPPVCSGASAAPALVWPPNHKLVTLSILGVTDADHDGLTITINRITQDQPSNGTGDGNTTFDATGVGTSTAAVRAERTGNLRVPDDGRLYQIDFTASDGKAGGTCTGTVYVGVPHDQGQHNLPADNGCRWDSTTGVQLGACAWLHAPALTLTNRTNREGDVVTIAIVAVDADGTPLTYTATGLPPGLTLSSSGVISGTVASGAAGGRKGSKVYTVSVSVSDGFGGDTKSFSWTITGS